MRSILSMLLLQVMVWGTAHAADLPLRHHASPSPDGTKLAYHARSSNDRYGLYILDLSGGEEQHLFGAGETIAQEPRWSPRGDLIAFVAGSHYNNGGLQLHIIRPDGTGLKRLTMISDGKAKGPSWSPDGSMIAFGIRNDEAGTAAIHVINVDGSGLRQLTRPEAALKQPEWSPDGRHFLARRDTDGEAAQSDLVLFAMQSPTNVTALTATAENETMPVWSPDGRYIAFARDSGRNGQYDVFVLRLEDQREWRLTNTLTLDEYFPIFAPDGRSVYHGQFAVTVHGYQSAIRRLPLPPELE